jgi:hypothetical protein
MEQFGEVKGEQKALCLVIPHHFQITTHTALQGTAKLSPVRDGEGRWVAFSDPALQWLFCSPQGVLMHQQVDSEHWCLLTSLKGQGSVPTALLRVAMA